MCRRFESALPHQQELGVMVMKDVLIQICRDKQADVSAQEVSESFLFETRVRFVGAIADYIDRIYGTEAQYSISEFFNVFKADDCEILPLSVTKFVFSDEARDNAIAKFYRRFRAALAELSKVRFSEFAENSANLQSELSMVSGSDVYGVYIYNDDGEIENILSWARRAKVGTTYYIGSVFAYHF